MADHHFVATAVRLNADQVLLCRRHPDRRWYPNVWDVPGGHVDAGELPADAVRRELREELGVTNRLEDPEPFRSTTQLQISRFTPGWSPNGPGKSPTLRSRNTTRSGWFGLDDLRRLDLADRFLEGLLTDAVALVVDRD